MAVGDELRVEVKAWVDGRGETLLGRGRGELLEAVAEHGSISAAAREIGLSYATAWHRLSSMSKAAGVPLLQARAGGRRGGGAKLTAAGVTLVGAWHLLDRRVTEFRSQTEAELRELLDGIPESTEGGQ